MPPIPRPTKDSVQKLFRKLTTEWSDRLATEERLRDLIHKRNVVDMLEPSEKRNMEPIEIHSGRAGGIIEHANGLLMAQPKFKMQPRDLTTEAKLESDQVERVCAKLFEQQLLANDFWPGVGRDVLGPARSFIKAMTLPTVWTTQHGYPTRKKDETGKAYLARVRKWKETEGQFPFVIQHVPTQNILPLVDLSDNVLCALEEKLVPAYVLAEEMGSANVKQMLARGDAEWYDEMLCLEYTDPNYVGYYLVNTKPLTGTNNEIQSIITQPISDFEELRVWEHGLGKCPVIMIPGMKTELQDKDGRYKSFLSDAQEPLEAYDMLISRLATMVWAYYLPSYVWKLAEGSAVYQGRERPTLTVNLGGVTTEYADEDLRPLPPPEHLPDAVLLTQQVDDLIQRHTLEDVLYGRVAGSAPAFQVNLRINVARAKLVPLAQHMAQGITNVMDLFLRGVMYLGESVSIDGEEITPSMAKSALGRVTASIEPKSPTDRAQDLGTANMAKQFGLPEDWIMEHILDIEDPATLRLEGTIARLEATQEADSAVLTAALRQLDLLVEEDEFEDMSGIDVGSLPPEIAAALQQVIGGGTPEEGGIGLGRGPYPEGGAPQTIQGGRGLLTPKTQPQPSAAQVSTPG